VQAYDCYHPPNFSYDNCSTTSFTYNPVLYFAERHDPSHFSFTNDLVYDNSKRDHTPDVSDYFANLHLRCGLRRWLLLLRRMLADACYSSSNVPDRTYFSEDDECHSDADHFTGGGDAAG
jgi:hypothetical protein